MALDTGLLRTRVARRVLLLFVVGAIVPAFAMGLASLISVRGQLFHQSQAEVEAFANNAGQSVLQQLVEMESSLHQFGRLLSAETGAADSLAAFVPGSVSALAESRGGKLLHLRGELNAVPVLDSARQAHLAAGHMLVVERPRRGGILAAVAMDSTRLDRGILWAQVVPDSLWVSANLFTNVRWRHDFCVLGADAEPLYCHSGSLALAEAFRDQAMTEAFRDQDPDRHSGVVRQRVAGVDLLTGYHTIPLAPSFRTAEWTVLVAESLASVYQPRRDFLTTFLVALLTAVFLVLLLTNAQVRRTMKPLSALEEGTRRLAAGDLGTRVEVTTDDEFATVAGSFNHMAGRLALMFSQIETGRAIDDAVLTARSRDDAVAAVLGRFYALVPSREVGVLLTDDEDSRTGTLRTRSADGLETTGTIPLGSDVLAWLRERPNHRIVSGSAPVFGNGVPDGSNGHPPVRVVFPFVAREQVLGALWYEPPADGSVDVEDVARGRQIADQVTVAVDELRLMAELEELNWGTLRALARAIDAKSRWTAGHSERVTELAMGIAREMGARDDDLEILRRGGLLHDVGKIGVPAEILDWQGRLSPEQRAIMQDHPAIGVRILEPIRAFRPSLPIVAEHHERWDGKGYPAGLAGQNIHPLARILAVADVYDAMVSPRPYRDSMDPAVVIAHIEASRGQHFEPRAVDAFLRFMAHRPAEAAAHD